MGCFKLSFNISSKFQELSNNEFDTSYYPVNYFVKPYGADPSLLEYAMARNSLILVNIFLTSRNMRKLVLSGIMAIAVIAGVNAQKVDMIRECSLRAW